MGLIILVCGSRYYADYGRILGCLKRMEVSLVIAGSCRGADTLAVRAAKELGIPFVEYKADWVRFGKAAGPIRNSKSASVMD